MFLDTVQQMGIVTMSPTRPTNALSGDLWFNTGTNGLSTYDGSNWILVTGTGALPGGGANVTIAGAAPTAPTTGDFWVDTANSNTIKVWDGAHWLGRTITHDGGRY